METLEHFRFQAPDNFFYENRTHTVSTFKIKDEMPLISQVDTGMKRTLQTVHPLPN